MGPDTTEMGEAQSPARTTRDYAVQLLRRYGNGPTIRRVFFAGGAVGVSLVIALVIAGGLTFKREIDYVECERFAVPFASVHIQNSPKGSGWGNPAFLAYSSYGPPYDLLMYGTLAEGDAATSFQLNDLVVEADGAPQVKLRAGRRRRRGSGGAPGWRAPAGARVSLPAARDHLGDADTAARDRHDRRGRADPRQAPALHLRVRGAPREPPDARAVVLVVLTSARVGRLKR